MASSDQLIRAVQVATRKLASTGNFDSLLRDVLAICVDAVGASGGTIYLHDPAKHRLRFQHVLPAEVAGKLPFHDIPDDQGVAGAAFQTRQTQISDFPERAESRNEVESATGVIVRTMITVPLMMEDETPIGVVQLINKKGGSFTDSDVAVLDTVAAVSTMAYLNSQLLEESTRASTLLGMGKVSHDIGNLAASLFANISFSDMALEGMRKALDGKEPAAGTIFVESLEETFGDLRLSVDRIVRYSRLISDLSAGRELRPQKKVSSLAETIEHAAGYLETDARKNGVALHYDIQRDAPPTAHDDLYVFRIVQNLVGNAIKAVRETISDNLIATLEDDGDVVFGEVTVRYRFESGRHILEVRDSGPGMPPEVAERILAGNARSQWDKGSGSGWGTKIVLELAATHGAAVEIDSELGNGSTFRVVMPHSAS